jgi:peptidoglycan/LPS O-acetylase OafA/YrhL
MKVSERIFGLDIIRALATILIVYYHSKALITDYFNFPDSISVPDPVDLFFVGSGFLVGRIMIKFFINSETYTFKSILQFLKRRWFRTFPNYYFFLIINIVLVYLNWIPGKVNENTAVYFGFMQNVYQPFDLFFWESWSLVIEEWFYPIVPIILVISFYVFRKKFNAKRCFLLTTIALIILPTLYRLFSYSPDLDWDLYFRKLVLTRMDTIGFGLLVAYLQVYHFNFFNKHRYWTFAIGLGLYIFTSIYLKTWSHQFQCVFFFTATAVGVSLMFPALYSWKSERIPFKPFRFVSLISYSVYLIHLPIYYLTISWYEGASLSMTIFYYFTYWVMVFVGAYLVYRFFEKPMMELRDRIK